MRTENDPNDPNDLIFDCNDLIVIVCIASILYAILYVKHLSLDTRVFGGTQADNVIGWKRVMQIILCAFNYHKRMNEIQKMLHNLLANWAKEGWMGRGKEIISTLLSSP